MITRTFIDAKPYPARSRMGRALSGLRGAALSPLFWLFAHRSPPPGLWLNPLIARMGIAAALGPVRPKVTSVYSMLFWPLDSTRYFEFDFAFRAVAGCRGDRFLDVSSPRLFPLMVLRERATVAATLLNPDPKDLAETSLLTRSLGLEARCRTDDALIENADYPPASFDFITSISVFEHIPDESRALTRVWELLKPGGRLVLTLPCARTASEQYISDGAFGLLLPDSSGYTFWQRFFDRSMIEARVYGILGRPVRSVVFGEKTAGTFQRDASRKRSDPNYPFWREPLEMGRQYRFFGSIDDLPGEGVIGLEFVKE